MTEVSKDKFLQAYGNLLAQSWGDPALLARFKAAPGKVLAEYGLDPEGAVIEIVSPAGGSGAEGSPDLQVGMWNDGKKAGRIKLYFPEDRRAFGPGARGRRRRRERLLLQPLQLLLRLD